MIKRGKYYLDPPKDGSNFKELFQRLAAAGAGQSVDEDGVQKGPWTPELLADAISQLDANEAGIELRTVQRWFQDNEMGISTENIRWLSRVFGCGDPEATSEWQAELSGAQLRLTAKRRATRKQANSEVEEPHTNATNPKRGFSLARWSEGRFGGSPLDLPSSVFAGAVALGFSSYFLGNHDATYGLLDQPAKQVGFLWAPNWTFLFMVFLPLFFAFVIELVVFWKNEGRSFFLVESDRFEVVEGWMHKVETSSFTYWAVFLICLGFAGLFQWVEVRLMPLMNGGGDFALDWGSLALVRPEVISVPQAIAFTGFAYLYMCLCFYLFFVGLILLYTLAYDLWEVGKASGSQADVNIQDTIDQVNLRVMRGIFRCTLLGILVAICMKLQTTYLNSNGTNILGWLGGDMVWVFGATDVVEAAKKYNSPTHYSSLIIALATCVPFLYGSVRLGYGSHFHALWAKMAGVVTLLIVSYLLIGAFPGFSILMSIGVLLALYGLFDPALGQGRTSEKGDSQSVL